MIKECTVFKKGMCLGCTGLVEKDWCGAERCEIYQKQINQSINECKRILGIQERIKL